LFDDRAKSPRVVEFIDLRVVRELVTDEARVVKVHRRSAEIHWPETLPHLLEFLRPRIGRDLVVEHVDRAG
jgi:hypothetical protein